MARPLKIKLNPPVTAGRRAWNDNQKREQSKIARARKPWLASTGPKTIEGKKTSSGNAFKHGAYSGQTKRFKRVLRLQSAFLKKYKADERIQRQKRRAVLELLKQGWTSESYRRYCEEKNYLNERTSHNDERTRQIPLSCQTLCALRVRKNPAFANITACVW